MIKILCDACHFFFMWEREYCRHPKSNPLGKRRMDSNHVPIWCPLKIKYSFPYHIERREDVTNNRKTIP